MSERGDFTPQTAIDGVIIEATINELDARWRLAGMPPPTHTAKEIVRAEPSLGSPRRVVNAIVNRATPPSIILTDTKGNLVHGNVEEAALTSSRKQRLARQHSPSRQYHIDEGMGMLIIQDISHNNKPFPAPKRQVVSSDREPILHTSNEIQATLVQNENASFWNLITKKWAAIKNRLLSML